jgi:hypothetical protein
MTTMIHLTLLLAPLAGQVFTVDDDGPADFSQITEAIASPLVGDGDVLLVEPGDYASFTLTKALEVVGAARGWVSVGSEVRVEGVERFALVGLRMRDVRVEDVPGRSRIEDCTLSRIGVVDGELAYSVGELHVVDCGALVVSRTLVKGDDACYPDGPHEAHPAVRVDRSSVAFVDSELIGGFGEGLYPVCSSHYPTAGDALIVRGGSRVLVSGCTLVGGVGPFSSSRPALSVSDSVVEVRGSALDGLVAAAPTLPIAVSGRSTVVLSGVPFSPSVLPPEVVVGHEPAPSLRLHGGVAPGDFLALELFGPTGAPGVLLLGAEGGPSPADAGLVPLLLDRDALIAALPVVLDGTRRPVVVGTTVPADPALVGTCWTAQGLIETASGPVLTNPADRTVRP